MPLPNRSWLIVFTLSIVSLPPLQAQTALTQRDSLRRDSLDMLRRELVRTYEARPKYGVPMIDRLFRYEPGAPYNQNRGYQFLHAVAGGIARNKEGAIDKPTPLKRLIDIGGGKDFDWGKWRIGVNGLIDFFPSSNDIDGQWLGYGGLVRQKLGEGWSLRLRSTINYALKSQNWYHEHNLLFYYAPRKNGLFIISGGHTSRETFHLTPEEIYRGYFGTLPGANTPIVEFVKDYLHVRNRISLSESFDISSSLLFEHRKPQVGLPWITHRTLLASGQVLWAPAFLNRSESGIPIPIGHRREVGIIYKQAFAPRSEQALSSTIPYTRYQLLEAFVRGTLPLTENNKIEFKFNAGTYLSRQYLSRNDEKYFAHTPLIDRTPFRDSWATLPLLFTGGKSWVTQELNFYSNQFLLSRTKGFGGFFRMDEALHSRNLLTGDGRAFTEIGYSIGWGDMSRFGLFAGYEWYANRPHIAFRISLPILCLTSSASERD